MTNSPAWIALPFKRLIPVGEIDSHGRFFIDSLFHHRHNAEKYAKVLLQRGAFRVAIDGIVVDRSKLARQMGAA